MHEILAYDLYNADAIAMLFLNLDEDLGGPYGHVLSQQERVRYSIDRIYGAPFSPVYWSDLARHAQDMIDEGLSGYTVAGHINAVVYSNYKPHWLALYVRELTSATDPFFRPHVDPADTVAMATLTCEAARGLRLLEAQCQNLGGENAGGNSYGCGGEVLFDSLRERLKDRIDTTPDCAPVMEAALESLLYAPVSVTRP